MLISSLLQRVAAEQVRQTVANGARKQSSKSSNDDSSQSHSSDASEPQRPDAELLPCHTGLVFALALESGHLRDRLTGTVEIQGAGFRVATGGLKGRGIAVLHAGPGRDAALRGTEALIAGHRPRWVISAGFAGALQPNIARGDIVMVNSVANLQGERLAIDLRVNAQTVSKLSGVHVGRLLSVDSIVRKPEDKQSLGRQHDALAVDMETMAVAEVCRREKQRFMAIRVISDTMDEELPADIERLLHKRTTAQRIGAAAGGLVRRPSGIKDLWRLRENALSAADRLAKFLEGVIVQLPRD